MKQAGELEPAPAVALAWQPVASRPALAALFMLDLRLATLVRRAREPMLAQVRLAWWRERLEEAPGSRPLGEPLLSEITAHWGGAGERLSSLVDGWEQLLDDPPFTAEAIDDFASGRGAALAAFAELAGVPNEMLAAHSAGRMWGLADIAARESGETAKSARELASREPAVPVRTSGLRGVAVLGGLARRALRRGEAPMQGRGAALAAIRLGMFGG